MSGSKAVEVPGDLREIPRVEADEAPGASVPGRLLSPGWAWFAGLSGPAVAAICIALEPRPADPSAAVPVIASLLQVALLAVWALSASAAVRRAPQALSWAAGGSAVLLALAVTCPASGHHTGVGAWWFTQLGVSGGALAVAVAQRAKLRRRPVRG